MNLFYLIISIIATILIPSIFYFIKIERHKKMNNHLLYCFLFGAASSFFIIIISRFIFTFLYSTIGMPSGDNLIFLINFTIQNLIEIFILYGILIVFLNNDIDKKEKFDGIIFAVYINAGFLFVKFIFPGFLYGIFMGSHTGIITILLSFSSVIILGYFVGLDKREKKNNIELHLIGLGGAIFIEIFYYALDKYLTNSITTKIIYIGFLIITSVYLTKNHLDEMNEA